VHIVYEMYLETSGCVISDGWLVAHKEIAGRHAQHTCTA